jgi:hypothetical protein
MFTHVKPSVKHLHGFGCDVFTYNHKNNRENKLDQTSNKGIHDKIFVTRDVKFYDTSFKNAMLLSEQEDGEYVPMISRTVLTHHSVMNRRRTNRRSPVVKRTSGLSCY